MTDGREPEGPDDGRIRIHAGMEDVPVAARARASLAGKIVPPPLEIECREPWGGAASLHPGGRFRVDGVPAGRPVVLDLAIVSRTNVRTNFQILCEAPGAAGEEDLGTLPVDSIATVTGVVEDAGGSPVEGATVHVAVGNPYEPTYTDERGRFSLTVRPVAPVVLEAGAPGLAARYVAVEKPGAAPVRVALDEGGLVRGRIVGADGRAVPGAYIVFWRRLDGGQLSPCEDWKPDVDSAGRFAVRLPPGTYHLRFYDMAFSHARVPGPDVTVRAGEAQDLDVRLP
jgi:hypothetical protein